MAGVERRQRITRLGVMGGLTTMLITVTVCAAALAGETKANRCGHTASAQGRLGVYVARGKVNCAAAGRMLANAFKSSYGTPLDTPTGQILTPSGWTCYGQMGVYECDYGTKRSVTGLGCSSLFGCPRRATVGTPNAQEGNLAVARCIPAHLASSGSARSARVLEPSRAFDVIARRARSSDLHWGDLVRNCGRALADKTWFVVLHPHEGADSHLFAVPLASGAWVQLGDYSY